jgi:hypothetical protein
MRSRSVWLLRAAIWLLAATLILAGILFGLLNRNAEVAGEWGPVPNTLLVLVIFSFVTLGGLVSYRRPGNAVGWIIALMGILLALSGFAQSYGVYALYAAPDSLPGGEVMAWFSAWTIIPCLFAAPALLFLLFPDGHLISRRWLVVFWLVIAATCVTMLSTALDPVLSDAPFEGVVNPFGVDTSDTSFALISPYGWPGMAAGLLAAAVAMIVRLRRARGVERQQLKWIASAATVLPLTSLTAVVSWYLGWYLAATTLPFLAPVLIPLAAGYAVLKYRLYDIDIIINRTLVYGSLTITLALVYFGGVVTTQTFFRALTGQAEQSQLAVVVSTLAIAALFNPLRRRIQAFIDRLFYRRKYDASRTLDAFSYRLRDETDLATLNNELVTVVRETMQPEHISLWLNPADNLPRYQSMHPGGATE